MAAVSTKFWPYNVVRNKVALPIANVPAVRRVVDALVKQGVTRLVVVVGPGESVRHALHGALPFAMCARPRPCGKPRTHPPRRGAF
ncbi:MAG: hypothetical protein R2851_28375 [Caldilineaceae bacterium]